MLSHDFAARARSSAREVLTAKLGKHGRMLMTVSRNAADILDGIEDLSSWDDEELVRGRRRNKHGNFSGLPPKVVLQAVHAERVRRTMSTAYDVLRESIEDAVELLRNVVNDLEAPLNARVQAEQLNIDRTLGSSMTAPTGRSWCRHRSSATLGPSDNIGRAHQMCRLRIVARGGDPSGNVPMSLPGWFAGERGVA